MKKPNLWGSLVLGLAVLALAACGALPGDDEGQPTVAINSPTSGAELPVSMPVDVQASAADPTGPGVARIDLQVNGVVVNSFEAAGPQANVSAVLSFTPTTEGATTITAISYRENGTASVPISISVLVVGVTPTATPEGEESAEASESSETSESEEAEPEPQGPVVATVETTTALNVRFGPSVNCEILGQYPEGSQVEVLAKSPDGAWLNVKFGSGEGWMSTYYTKEVVPLDDIPTKQGPFCEPPEPTAEPTAGPSCGNDVCDPGENFSSCPGDCDTCGNATCDAGESFGNCPGDCKCGNAVCDPGEDAASCPGDCKCGNGVCEPEYGEDFTTCAGDCTLLINPDLLQILPICGNNTVETGEECDPPGSTCGFFPSFGLCESDCTCGA